MGWIALSIFIAALALFDIAAALTRIEKKLRGE